MLRRKPTAITLTNEDIAIYEDARAREAAELKCKEELRERQSSQDQMQRDSDSMLTDQQNHQQNLKDAIQEPTMRERIMGFGNHRRH
ncbi:hypothetical protein HI914_00134 [Erysiphe necator]|uniref:Anaphase-promoting complex, subunit CDC26 n=1 Tax=Uncinula necator TaxID=52586 RepID=A0A0B1P6B9_UNCNE|nr:hypothetical protein HI914_00134 [Erysiphe necator]KHJ33778.1 hypothetical protein EV44_g5474 [Erysiphe necator]